MEDFDFMSPEGSRPDMDLVRQRAFALFKAGDYKAVIDLVDKVFGWKPGELERKAYDRQEAEICLQQL